MHNRVKEFIINSDYKFHFSLSMVTVNFIFLVKTIKYLLKGLDIVKNKIKQIFLMWFILAGLLITIFNPIVNYVFGTLSIYNSYLFAFTYFFLTILFTCTKRTENARLPTLVLVSVELFLENCVLKQTVYQEKEFLIIIIWFIRYLFIFATALALTYYYFKYNDLNQIIHEKLECIKNQNLYLIEMFTNYQSQIESTVNFQRFLKAQYANYKKQKMNEYGEQPFKMKAINASKYNKF